MPEYSKVTVDVKVVEKRKLVSFASGLEKQDVVADANIHPAINSVTLESIQKHFRKVQHYMFGYLEGAESGSELEATVKQYEKNFCLIGKLL